MDLSHLANGNGDASSRAERRRNVRASGDLDRPIPDSKLPADAPSWARGLTPRQLHALGLIFQGCALLFPHLTDRELGDAIGQMWARNNRAGNPGEWAREEMDKPRE